MKINVPGQMLMQAPEVSIEQAVKNFDVIVANMSCDNRKHRMILERSVMVLDTLVEQETRRFIAEKKAEAEAAKAKADADAAAELKATAKSKTDDASNPAEEKPTNGKSAQA